MNKNLLFRSIMTRPRYIKRHDEYVRELRKSNALQSQYNREFTRSNSDCADLIYTIIMLPSYTLGLALTSIGSIISVEMMMETRKAQIEKGEKFSNIFIEDIYT